ncbi:hypothetical protein B0H14DRAFT_2602205 [Mycena olivaceomarginata]|nr:hypothetical protein B0H14DRAFT_2602205 [Mycena olivaceomarginata]
MKSGPEKSSRYLKGIVVRITIATLSQDFSKEGFGRRIDTTCVVSRGWVEEVVRAKTLKEGGAVGRVKLDPFCKEDGEIIKGEGGATLLGDTGVGVPRGDKPLGHIIGLENEDGGEVVGALARGVAHGAHHGEVEDVVDRLPGLLVDIPEAPAPGDRPKEHLARWVDPTARGTRRRRMWIAYRQRANTAGGAGANTAGGAGTSAEFGLHLSGRKHS